jgi:hypothetical protein
MTTFSRNKFFLLCLLASLIFLWPRVKASAEDFFIWQSFDFPLSADQKLVSPAGEVLINIPAGAIDSGRLFVKATTLVAKDQISQFFNDPSPLSPASDLYALELELPPGQALAQPLTVNLKYQDSSYFQELYYYDEVELAFKKLSASRDTLKKIISFSVNSQPKIIFGLFNEPELVGEASWYVHKRYKKDLIAASRDFAQDARLKIQNLDNGKEVTVIVKDYGPKACQDWTEKEQKKMGPCRERVLDLSKAAFSQIASVRAGIIKIKVTPLIESKTE